ncbi:hypothetical protein DUNSADRAFT_10394 [Dunaliella salina]|uniref:Encoded protein n=1 Tax=Dunaliella salina TaxID=3046 RepID=A0ABQ7GFG6_DUNSA|nr:hypothetical protein DUNSADRAFT_10394 [Dunaliella salina]|eukprot:KAF5833353.1 hypothetical protein DUNSADRAFT_10394 [Dunaliella salina]
MGPASSPTAFLHRGVGQAKGASAETKGGHFLPECILAQGDQASNGGTCRTPREGRLFPQCISAQCRAGTWGSSKEQKGPVSFSIIFPDLFLHRSVGQAKDELTVERQKGPAPSTSAFLHTGVGQAEGVPAGKKENKKGATYFSNSFLQRGVRQATGVSVENMGRAHQ